MEYTCDTNSTFTKGQCVSGYSFLFWVVFIALPAAWVAWMMTLICCVKIRACPMHRWINYARKKQGKELLGGSGPAGALPKVKETPLKSRNARNKSPSSKPAVKTLHALYFFFSLRLFTFWKTHLKLHRKNH